jgi:hypothetical protein
MDAAFPPSRLGRVRRRPIGILALAAVLAVAGCGGGSGDDGKDEPGPAAKAADSFQRCFKLTGYHAKRPAEGHESLFALESANDGYAVDPVNVGKSNTISPSAFLVFFESPDKAKEAMHKVGASSIDGVPPAQRGKAVIGYLTKVDKTATSSSIERCLS